MSYGVWSYEIKCNRQSCSKNKHTKLQRNIKYLCNATLTKYLWKCSTSNGWYGRVMHTVVHKTYSALSDEKAFHLLLHTFIVIFSKNVNIFGYTNTEKKCSEHIEFDYTLPTVF